jgi:hypothetical protein
VLITENKKVIAHTRFAVNHFLELTTDSKTTSGIRNMMFCSETQLRVSIRTKNSAEAHLKRLILSVRLVLESIE